jgi:hypothetical protein
MTNQNGEAGQTADEESRSKARIDFLFHMYNQIFHDIDRHILVVWQSLSLVVGGFAVFALVEKQVIPLDIATALIILLVAWAIAHVYDAAHWYDRSIAIITNIERQFLTQSDLRDIHHYFESHRQKPRMIMHLRIQYAFASILGLIVLYYHFTTRVVPGFGLPITAFEPLRALPYFVLLVSTVLVLRLRGRRHRDYNDFIMRSPGAPIQSVAASTVSGEQMPASKPQT